MVRLTAPLRALARGRYPPRQGRAPARALGTAAQAPAQAQAPAPPKERRAGASTAQASTGLVDLQPPRGTRDFAPEDCRQKQWLFGEFQAVSRLLGFEEWEAPVLESEALFVRKAGDEITQQLYNFTDKGDRRVALRPELTPSLARLILKQGSGLPLPAKWATVGQCWRYERTTRGRRREHYQWNLDIVGVPGVEAEAELLSALVLFLERVGLGPQDVVIKVSSRRVLQALLALNGVPEALLGPVSVVLDKLDKLPQDKILEELGGLGVAPEGAAGLVEATRIADLGQLEARLGPESEACAELRRLFALAQGYGYAGYLQFDASCIRGLSYYTGVVFEGRDRAGQLRAIFGGGRYDRLLETFGGAPTPCAGFGFGDCVIVELLEERGLLPSFSQRVDCLVVALEEPLRAAACGVAAALRRAGRTTDLLLEPKKMKQVFRQAGRCGAAQLVLLAPTEWERGRLRVKDLGQRSEQELTLAELLAQPAPAPAGQAPSGGEGEERGAAAEGPGGEEPGRTG